VHPQDMNDFFTDARQPQAFYNRLDFRDFGTNAQWASWIYDNPGVDTDGDGFRGKFRLCCDSSLICTAYDTMWIPNPDVPGDSLIDTIVAGDEYFCDCDTLYYEGDGAPDFRGASPPPAPVVRVSPQPGSLIVRWNGLRSETTPDDFSSVLDFEGYRVYMGLNRRISDLILQASYDRKNFTRYAWNDDGDYWQIAGPPQTLEEIRYLYANGNNDYDPLVNGLDNPLPFGDSLLYFTKQDFNQDDLTDENEIHKPAKYRYNYNPDGTVMLDEFDNPVPTPYPHTLRLDSAFTSDTFLVDASTGDTTWYMGGELTEDGKFFKYFEYEFRLPNLLTSQLYYVSVTSFDFGAPETGLDALESNPLINAVAEFPQNSSDVIAQQDLGVVVYPNPYRVDGNYRAKGFEGREKDDFRDERVRQLNFTNLPPRCSIKIFTLDGDLVREIDHETIANAPQSMHDSWDLVTRNLQPAVSGIYYWTVEDKNTGEVQTGKLVLIM
ncbi:MAG TPA: hypothetical protein VLB27_04070, partial [candidate division Zixibacteria bacterium]|nr:hypothetical protein [candidate division Zixibacteria bacterium]